MSHRFICALCAISILAAMLCGCSENTDPISSGDLGFIQPDQTIVTVAKELADKIDDLPDAQTLLGNTTSSVRAMRAVTPDPENVEVLQQDISNVDYLINQLKKAKNEALSICKVLDTWVVPDKTGGSYNIDQPPKSFNPSRLNYDPNNNVVTIEQRSHNIDEEGNFYRKTVVCIDAEGRLVIDAYFVTFSPTQLTRTQQLHYVEGVCLYTVEDSIESMTDTLTFWDLQTRTRTIVNRGCSIKYDADGSIKNISYRAPSVGIHAAYGEHILSGDALYLSDGRLLATWYFSSACNVTINLNHFSGWSSIEKDGSSVTLVTEKGSFTLNSGFPNGLSNLYLNIGIYEPYDRPELTLRTPTDTHLTQESLIAALDVLQSSYGLYLQEADRAALVSAPYTWKTELASQIHLMNGIYASDVTEETYALLTDMLKTEKQDLETILGFYDEPTVTYYSQPQTYTYFEFIPLNVSGTAVIDAATGAISVEALTARLEPSVMLQDGKEYALVFVWSDGAHSAEVGRASGTYTGTALEFHNSITIPESSLPTGYGTYTLTAYVVLTETNGRISAAIPVPTDAAYEKQLSSDQVITLIYSNTRTLSVQNIVPPASSETPPEE